MKKSQNKTVYVVFDNFYSNIFGVFRSKQTLNKQLESWQQHIYDFAKSEELEVTVDRRTNSYGESAITISCNTPRYDLIVVKADIKNSVNINIDHISTVWITWSVYNPGVCVMHLSKEEALAYLDSMGLLAKAGKPNENVSLKKYKIK